MTVHAPLRTPAPPRVLERRWPAGAWLGPVALVAGLGAVVAARWLATRAGVDPLLVGTGFGMALLLVAQAPVMRGSFWRAPAPLRTRSLAATIGVARAGAVGLGFGLVLVGIAVIGPTLAGTTAVPGLARPAAPFLPWAAITVLVAVAEERLLRGVLLDRLERSGGIAVAVILTSAVFALMHVPLYGWHVVPLDLAVGIGLAGTRLATGSLVAPIAAHAIADLATWWL